ncbi:UbiH/UbiF/VisC/COQ6 family ubiquinone biosynthesis hydroxylase [Thiohalorhabdus methylotrophus]|uniref:UbiH/UbiF/VisC/COQ6 family ubiquinone biosynthesis hydroxylase n=1 Tax=Thiohalorhabdus methylotrophus TaxID=3242694 RepID=A0ABV4TQ26_9GAMM
MAEKVDVAVVGGGMAGATLAWALYRRGLEVALIEPGEPPEPAYEEAPLRVSAINAGSRAILADLGLWEDIAAQGAAPIGTIEVTDGHRRGRTLLDCREAGVEALGHVVSNRAVVATAWERIRAEGGATLLQPARMESMERGPDRTRITVESGGERFTLEARLVVGADGEHSGVRRAAGIGTWGWHHNRHAVVAVVDCERDLAGHAFERFLPEGPLAFLPLGGGRASIVWTLTPSAAAEVAELGTADFLARLRARFGPALGALHDTGERAVFPLELRLAERFTGDRAALVANAGHLVHPVAGQGFNLGLRDVAALAEELGNARDRGWDPGNAAVLGRYERRRRMDTTRVVAFTEGLNRLFGNEAMPLAVARRLGLAGLDRIGPLKRMLMNQAMGRNPGRLPRSPFFPAIEELRQ